MVAVVAEAEPAAEEMFWLELELVVGEESGLGDSTRFVGTVDFLFFEVRLGLGSLEEGGVSCAARDRRLCFCSFCLATRCICSSAAWAAWAKEVV